MNVLVIFLIMWKLCIGHKEVELAQPDYSIYHTKNEIMSEVHEIVENNPKCMEISYHKANDESYKTEITIITVDRGKLQNDIDNEKIKILITFNEHAREIITSEVALRLLETLADLNLIINYTDEFINQTDISKFLNNIIFKIIPIENPNGRDDFEAGDLCERKNGRDVDINRNWDIDFGIKEKDYDANEEYPGDYAFSEPETRIMKSVAEEFKPHVWINVHSGMFALFMPYDHIGHMPLNYNATKQYELLEILNKEGCDNECSIGSGGKTVGYVAHGTGTDFMYEKLHVPLSFTWEIYGDDTATYEDCFKMFNPIDIDTYEFIIRQWVQMVYRLVTILPRHPSIPNIALDKNIQNIALDKNIQNIALDKNIQNIDTQQIRVIPASFLDNQNSILKYSMIFVVVSVFLALIFKIMSFR